MGGFDHTAIERLFDETGVAVPLALRAKRRHNHLSARTVATADTVRRHARPARQTAHYMLRWINTKGDKGPWSETASATTGA